MAFRLNLHALALLVAQDEFAQTFAATCTLGLGIVYEHLVNCGVVAADGGTVLAVAVVFHRSVGVVVHLVVGAVDGADEASAAYLAVLRVEAGHDVHHTLGIEDVVHFGGADGAVAARLDDGESVLLGHLNRGVARQSVVGVGETIVFNPAVVVVDETFAVGHNILAVEGQGLQLARCVVDADGHVVVEEARLVHGEGLAPLVVALASDGGQCRALAERELCLSHRMASLAERLVFLIDHAEVEEHLVAFRAVLLEICLGQFQADFLLLSGGNGGKGKAFGGSHTAVEHHVVYQFVLAEVVEIVGVLQQDDGKVLGWIHLLEFKFHKLMGGLHFSQFRTLLAGGGDDTVGAEVALMRSREIVTRAEAIYALFDFAGFVDGLVHPVPDATANAGVAAFNNIPIFLEVADGVAHGVGVFTDEHRLVEVARVLIHPSHAGVHLRVEIGEASAAVVAVRAGAFVVNGARVERLGLVVAGAEVLAVASLVAKAPHDDGGAVAVAHHHTFDAVLEGGYPRFSVGDALVGVVLEVGFVHAVDAVVVKHGVHTCGIGIMGGADRVDIVLLHEQHIAEHRFCAYGATIDGVGVVAVGALEEDALAVDIDQGVANLHRAEAHLVGEGHFLVAHLVLLHHVNGVEVRRFGAPQFRLLQVKFHAALCRAVTIEYGFYGGLVHQRAVGMVERNLHYLLAFLRFAFAAKGQGNVECGFLIVVAEFGGEIVVADAQLGHVVEIHIAEDTAHAEHILTLQIRTIAPAEHLHGQGVLALVQEVRQVKLGHVVGALRVAHVLSVEPNEGRAVDAAEMDERAAAVPVVGNLEGAHVGAHGVDAVVGSTVIETRAGLDVGRRVGVGVLHIGIDGAVVALHLPVGGNGDGVPGTHVVAFLPEVHRSLRGLADEVEAPRTVEREVAVVDGRSPGRLVVRLVGQHRLFALVGHVGGYGRLLVFGEDGFVLPVGCLNLGLLHRFKGEPSRLVLEVHGHGFELAAAQGVHILLLALVGTLDDVGVGLAGHGHEVEAGVVPLAYGGGPLQEVVDGRVVAAVVEVLAIEGVLDGEGEEVNRLDIPELSAVFLAYRLGHDARIVFARVAVAQYEFGLGRTAYAIGQRIIETSRFGCADVEVCALGLRSLRLGNGGEGAILGNGQHHARVVGRDEQVALHLPQLCFVRTVVFAQFHENCVNAEGLIGHGVDDTPRARELAEFPVLTRVFLVECARNECAILVNGQYLRRLVFGRNVVELPLLEGYLRQCGPDA